MTSPHTPRGRRPVAPWDLPASIDAGLPREPAAWVARVAAAVSGAATMPDAAVALGFPARTLYRALAALRSKHPALAAQIPAKAAGGYRDGHRARRAATATE